MAIAVKNNYYEDFDVKDLLQYLRETPEESWCTDVVKTKTGKSCFFGHVFDYGGGDSNLKRANAYMNIFESCYATTYMIYPVNDGSNPCYTQPTPKQRCIAYLEDLISGKSKTTYQLMEETANH